LAKTSVTSPREEALEIAYKTRKMILESKPDAVVVLRRCLVVATILNKEKEIRWISKELSGYYQSDSKPKQPKGATPYYNSLNDKDGETN